MVPWTHCREPRLGRLLTDSTSEFTVFNLVIRLRILEQLAFFVFHHVDVGFEQLAAAIGLHHFG